MLLSKIKIGFLKVLKRLRMLKYFNFNISYKEFVIPIKNGIGLGLLIEEERWMELIFKEIVTKRKGLFVDVGANIGQTLLSLKVVLPKMSYIGFEPNPYCCKYLESLVKTNEWGAVELFKFALGGDITKANLQLYNNINTDQSATLVKNFRPNGNVMKTIEIDYMGQKELSKKLSKKISCIKVDVEGMEYEVFQALEDVIQRDRPVLIFEILPCYSAKMMSRIKSKNKLLKYFNENSYHVFRIVEGDSCHPYKLVNKKSIEMHGDMSLTNYIAIHDKCEDAILSDLRQLGVERISTLN